MDEGRIITEAKGENIKWEGYGSFPHSPQNSIGREVIGIDISTAAWSSCGVFATKRAKKACWLLFLIPSSTPFKIPQLKDYPLNSHQLPANSILAASATMEEGSRGGQLTQVSAPGH